MSRNIKIIRRRGIPYPPVEIQSLLIKHYLREKAICNKIRKLNRNNPSRTALLSEVYEIAHEAMEKYVEAGFLQHDTESKKLLCKNLNGLFANKGSLLELGCGRGNLILAMKELGWDVKGVEIDKNQVLNEIKEEVELADIFFYKDDRCYDLVVLDQVLEHIPKCDCYYIFKKIYKTLKKGGFLVSRSPNRLNGPHDVSRWFVPLGSKAEGSHFNEMTLTETIYIMKKVGFRNFQTPLIPFSSKVPSRLRFLFFWTKNKIPFAIFFERIYPLIPYRLKPTSFFPLFVPDTIAAQK